MSGNDISGIILSGSVGLLLSFIGIALLNGKGAWLIAGYNTMSKIEKSKWNEKALCRFVGWLIIVIAVCVIIMSFGAYAGMGDLPLMSGGALLIGIMIAAIVYVNTSKRFKKT